MAHFDDMLAKIIHNAVVVGGHEDGGTYAVDLLQQGDDFVAD